MTYEIYYSDTKLHNKLWRTCVLRLKFNRHLLEWFGCLLVYKLDFSRSHCPACRVEQAHGQPSEICQWSPEQGALVVGHKRKRKNQLHSFKTCLLLKTGYELHSWSLPRAQGRACSEQHREMVWHHQPERPSCRLFKFTPWLWRKPSEKVCCIV